MWMALMIGSCKSSKYISSDQPTDKLTIRTLESRIASQDSINWFAGKAKIKMTDNYGTQRGQMFIRMKSDSVIWLVFKRISVEAARVQINADSIVILDRMKKNYQTAQLDSISNVFGLSSDFEFLSNTMTGAFPQLDKSKLWQIKEIEEGFKIRSMIDDVVVDLVVDQHSGLLKSGQFYDRFLTTGTWNYSNYKNVSGLDLPFDRKFHIKFDEENFMELEVEFQEIDINNSYDIRFEIPQHYTVLD